MNQEPIVYQGQTASYWRKAGKQARYRIRQLRKRFQRTKTTRAVPRKLWLSIPRGERRFSARLCALMQAWGEKHGSWFASWSEPFFKKDW